MPCSLLKPRTRLAAGLGAAASLGALSVMGSARADVAVVSQVAVTEVAQPSLNQVFPLGTTPPQRRESAHSPQTVVTYYKGGNARTEVKGGDVVLYNGADGRLYTLDPAQKTYYTRSVKDTLEPPAPSAGNFGAQSKVDASIDVKPGDAARTLAGTTAKVYTVSGVVTLTPQRRSFGGTRGGGGQGRRHGRGGGGFPGGGFPGGGGGFPLFQQGGFPQGDDQNGGGPDGYPGSGNRSVGRTRSLEVSGEFWLSDAVKLPDDKKASLLPMLQASFSGGKLALKSLTDALNKKKEIPLSSRLTLTHTVSQTGMQDSVTTTMQVTSVSSAPLSDALFRLPLGYTQIAPPAVDASGADLDSGDSHAYNPSP